MSSTIVSVAVLLLSQLLPLIGIHLGSEALETTLQTIVAVVAGIWIWYRRVAKGDVNVVGALRK